MKVVSLYRHLVKGFCQESLTESDVRTGGTLVGDRAFAFQFVDTAMAPSATNAPWIPKMLLAVQHDWPDLARIVPSWNSTTRKLKLQIEGSSVQIEESVDDSPAGLASREKLANFVHQYLQQSTPYSKARHPETTGLRLIGNENFSTRYTDGEKGPVSFALRETIRDIESKFGFSVDEKRFRLNVFLEGAPAWSELTWVGKKLRVGKCVFEFYKPIGRCPNIDVDQKTGARHSEVFPDLKAKFGHSLMGVKAEVLKGATLKVGDDWEILT